MKVEVTKYNVHIENSYQISKKNFDEILELLRREYPDTEVWKRTNKCMDREWATHNLCYALHLFRRHTASVDLNYPQNFLVRAAYTIVGSIALLLIR